MARRADISRFVLAQIEGHPQDISRLIQARFGISRTAAVNHLNAMIHSNVLQASGNTRARRYELRTTQEKSYTLKIEKGVTAEHTVWTEHIVPLLDQNVESTARDILHYAVTEMVNNAIDHSEGSALVLEYSENAVRMNISVFDNGVGIFEKVAAGLGLNDSREAALELSKGKVTTDPANHSGEGIFFTSRATESFSILSSGIFFVHTSKSNDWFLESREVDTKPGTLVQFSVKKSSRTTLEQVFDRFSSPDGEYRFNRTIVPVELAQIGDEQLVSRSQAKRLLARLEKFDSVVFDFDGVASIGQAFADEVFRVFVELHPNIDISAINAKPALQRMINRAQSSAASRNRRERQTGR